MEEKKQHFECEDCNAEFSIETDMDMLVEFCPFCSEPLDVIEWSSDYEGAIGEGEGT